MLSIIAKLISKLFRNSSIDFRNLIKNKSKEGNLFRFSVRGHFLEKFLMAQHRRGHFDELTFASFTTLSILQLIKEAQQKHGLRHADYQRYRFVFSNCIDAVSFVSLMNTKKFFFVLPKN